LALRLHFRSAAGANHPLTLRIERISGRHRNRIRLSGEFRAGHIDQVKAELSGSGTRVVLDLNEVDLLDVECVRFLNQCAAEGISILHCSPYIKEWMLCERKGNRGKP
jgi:hypothetical protein